MLSVSTSGCAVPPDQHKVPMVLRAAVDGKWWTSSAEVTEVGWRQNKLNRALLILVKSKFYLQGKKTAAVDI